MVSLLADQQLASVREGKCRYYRSAGTSGMSEMRAGK